MVRRWLTHVRLGRACFPRTLQHTSVCVHMPGQHDAGRLFRRVKESVPVDMERRWRCCTRVHTFPGRHVLLVPRMLYTLRYPIMGHACAREVSVGIANVRRVGHAASQRTRDASPCSTKELVLLGRDLACEGSAKDVCDSLLWPGAGMAKRTRHSCYGRLTLPPKKKKKKRPRPSLAAHPTRPVH